MRLSHLLCTALSLCAFAPDSSSAQGDAPYDQRVQWAAPPQALDSTTIQLRIIDLRTGNPVPALLCFWNGMEVVSDPDGEVRISGLRQANTWVSVLASGHAATSLIFYPGKRGRSFATVRLVPDSDAAAKPTCRDAKWPVERGATG